MLYLIKTIVNNISKIVSYLYKFRDVYKVAGFFATRKFSPAKNLHKYAVLIAARNEETVIGNLVDSIREQDYPSDLVDIFVVADNCTDNTAEIARQCGAKCYERNDITRRTKGFALQYLVECIRQDYGIEAYEGYFIFDADNLLKKDFISRMNDSFDAGEKIITSYRNTKNFDDNWISASYGIHWLRTVRNEHRARSLFRLATRIQGTGFLFANEVIKDGWNYTSLTEDRAFCADAVANGYKISYNNAAEFYDEQPVDMKVAMRQRIRWAKGHLQALVETGGTLFSHIFITKGAGNVDVSADTPRWKRFVNNVRLRFMSFDMLTVVFPRTLTILFKRLLVLAINIALVFTTGYTMVNVWYGPKAMEYIYKFFGWSNTAQSTPQAITMLVVFFFAWSLSSYINNSFNAAYVFIMERKRIVPMKWYKKVWFCITFPIFDLIGKYSMLIALFQHVEWDPIPHKAAVSISELNSKIISKDNSDK